MPELFIGTVILYYSKIEVAAVKLATPCAKRYYLRFQAQPAGMWMVEATHIKLNVPGSYAILPAVGVWRSLEAHLHGVQGVAGSNPVTPTSYGSDTIVNVAQSRLND